jgi:hypothetical protein
MAVDPTSLMFAGLTALVLAIASGQSGALLPAGIVMAYFALSWLNKYAFALLDRAMNGGTEAPVASVEMLAPFGDFRPWVHPTLVAVAGWAVWSAPPSWRLAIVAAAALLFPASLGALALSSRLADAVNPLALWRTQRGLGAWGLLLWVALLAAAAIDALLWRIAGPPMLRIAVAELSLLTLYAVTGAALYTRRLELDFDPMAAPERQSMRDDAERVLQRQRVFDEVYGLVRARDAIGASAALDRWLVEAEPARRLGDVAAILSEASTWPDKRGLLTVARTIIGHGLRAKQPALAVAAAAAALRELPDYAPDDDATTLALAEAALQSGQRRLATQLIDRWVARAGTEPGPALVALRERIGR